MSYMSTSNKSDKVDSADAGVKGPSNETLFGNMEHSSKKASPISGTQDAPTKADDDSSVKNGETVSSSDLAQLGILDIKADLKTIMTDFEKLSAHTGETLDLAKSSVSEVLVSLGDRVEKLGERMNRAGFTTIGKTVEKIGDKLEHLNSGHNA
jgi:hypothetical protein